MTLRLTVTPGASVASVRQPVCEVIVPVTAAPAVGTTARDASRPRVARSRTRSMTFYRCLTGAGEHQKGACGQLLTGSRRGLVREATWGCGSGAGREVGEGPSLQLAQGTGCPGPLAEPMDAYRLGILVTWISVLTPGAGCML